MMADTDYAAAFIRRMQQYNMYTSPWPAASASTGRAHCRGYTLEVSP